MAKRKKAITTKAVSVEISFHGNGTIIETRPNVFVGGVVAPQIGENLHFNVRREMLDDDGVLNPTPGEDAVEGAFQINVWGNSEGFRELARYLLAIAELDTGNDQVPTNTMNC